MHDVRGPRRVLDSAYGPVTVFTIDGSIFVSCAGLGQRPGTRHAVVRFTRTRTGEWQPIGPLADRANGAAWSTLAPAAVAAAIADGLLEDAGRPIQQPSRRGLIWKQLSTLRPVRRGGTVPQPTAAPKLP